MRCDGCPVPEGGACPGEKHARLCVLRLSRPEYAALLARAGRPEPGPEPAPDPRPLTRALPPTRDVLAPPPMRRGHAVDPTILDLVLRCPDRGGVLPLSLQADCGCGGERGAELSECRAGKGTTPGRVTTQICVACRSAARSQLTLGA